MYHHNARLSFENVGTWGVIFQSFDTTARRPSRKAGVSALVCGTRHHCVTFVRVPDVIEGFAMCGGYNKPKKKIP